MLSKAFKQLTRPYPQPEIGMNLLKTCLESATPWSREKASGIRERPSGGIMRDAAPLAGSGRIPSLRKDRQAQHRHADQLGKEGGKKPGIDAAVARAVVG